MKKFLKTISIIAVFSVIGFTASAQMFSLYLAGGYNFSNGKFKGLNFMLDRYNQTRPYLSKQMGDINNLQGFGAELGANISLFNIGISYVYRGAGTTADAPNAISGGYDVRSYRVRYHSIGISPGFLTRRKGIIRPVIGVNVELNYLLQSTRLYDSEAGKNGDWTPLIGSGNFLYNNQNLSFSPFVDLRFHIPSGRVAISVKPYYLINTKDYNFQAANSQLNPVTYVTDDPKSLSSRMSGFGVEIRLLVPLVRVK